MIDLLPSSADLAAFAPEIILLIGAAAALLVPMLLPRQNLLAVPVAAAGALAAAFLMLFYVRSSALAAPASYFAGLLVLDPFAWGIKFLLIGFTLVVMALWLTDSHDKFITQGQAEHVPAFFAMLLSAALGLCLMASTTHLLVIFLAMEIASLPAYVLVGFRKRDRAAARAAAKYVLFGLACSAFMLYGMSLLYGLFGSLDLQQIGGMLTRQNGAGGTAPGAGAVFRIALLTIVLGAGCKVALVPVHFWCPDAFEGAGIDVSTFLSVAPLTAGMALLMRILVTVSGSGGAGGGGGALAWLSPAMLFLGVITCFCGNLGALPQTNIKRLLAWSGIGQAGCMLMGMSVLLAPARHHVPGLPEGQDLLSSPAAEVVLFYLLMYLFMNGGAFVAAAAIAQRLSGPADAGMSLGVDKVISATLPAKADDSTGEDIRQYAGLSRRAPILAATMLVFLLSLAGMPLTIGFAARIKLFTTLFDLGSPLGWLSVAVIAVNTVLAAVSCLRIIREMYMMESEAPRLIEIAPVTIVALVLAVPNLAFFVGYSWVDHQAQRHAQILGPVAPEERAHSPG